MKNKLKFLLLYTLVSVINLNAQQDKAVVVTSVENAIEQALLANPNITVYNLQKEKAKRNYKIAKAHRLPIITGTFTGQRNISIATTPLPGDIFGQPGEIINAQLGQEFNFNGGIYISKNLFDWQLSVNSKIAKANIVMADLDTESFKQKLKEQTSLYYFSAIITKEALRINDEDLKIADSINTLTTQKFDKGLIDKISANQALINYHTIKQTKSNNEQLLNTYLNELQILLGLNSNDTLVLSETINNFDVKLMDITSLNKDVALKISMHQKEQSLLSLKYQKAIYYPKLTLNSYLGQQQFRDNFGLTFNNGDWTNYRYINLNLSIPIFTGFSNKNKIKISKIEYEIASKNFEIQEENSSLNDNLLLKNYQTSLNGLQSSLDNYYLRKENSELTLQKYNEGLIGLDAYFNSFEDYLKSENNYLNTLSSTYAYYATLLSRQ